jgi:hypothetical protein
MDEITKKWFDVSMVQVLVGYYAWARLGFSAPLPDDLREHAELPESCRACKDVLDLLVVREGRKFWLRYGRSLSMEFLLKEASASWGNFRHYARERNIEVMP